MEGVTTQKLIIIFLKIIIKNYYFSFHNVSKRQVLFFDYSVMKIFFVQANTKHYFLIQNMKKSPVIINCLFVS